MAKSKILRETLFHPIIGAEKGSRSPLTPHERELAYVLEARVEPRIEPSSANFTSESAVRHYTTGWVLYSKSLLYCRSFLESFPQYN